MITATFPPYNDEIEDFKITPEIEEKMKAWKHPEMFEQSTVADVSLDDAEYRKTFQRQNTLDTGELFEPKHSHYFKDVTKLHHIDVYRVLDLFGVTDPCLQHAVKKLLVAGGRGAKDMSKDVAEAIDTLKRWQQMQEENLK